MPHLVFQRHEALLYLVEHADKHILTVGSSTDVFRDALYDASLFPHVTHVQAANMTSNEMHDLVVNLRPDVIFYEPDAVEQDIHNAVYTRTNSRLYQVDDNSPRDAEMALLEQFETEYRNVLAAWVTSESQNGTSRSILDARRDVRLSRVEAYSAVHRPAVKQDAIATRIKHVLHAEHQARLVNQYHTLMENLAALREELPYVTLPGDMLTALQQWARRQDGE